MAGVALSAPKPQSVLEKTKVAVQEQWVNATYVKNGAVDTGGSSAKLAVRSGPGINFNQVDALSSGQKVTVLETKNGWSRIGTIAVQPSATTLVEVKAVPVLTVNAAANSGSWVNATYVKSGVVDTGGSSAKLAVRSGPGVSFNQVDALSAGQKVTVLEIKDGWIKIIAQPVATPVVAAPVVQKRPLKQRPAAPVAVAVSTPVPTPVSVVAVTPRPVPVPVRPPVDNLILNGDFSGASLALPTSSGDTTAELSGRWLRSVVSSWEIAPYGGNLGPYVRAAASRETGRLLYVVSDAKRSKGSYVLRFDYKVADPSDVLSVKVFVSDRDITVGTDGGDFRMNNTQRPSDMVLLPVSASWATYYLPVELGGGYNYVYVLFIGSGAGDTGVDNISLSPCRR